MSDVTNDDIEQCYGKTVLKFDGEAEHPNCGRIVKIDFTDGTSINGYPVGDCCAVTNIVEVVGDWFLGKGQGWVLTKVEQENLASRDLNYDCLDIFVTILTFTEDDDRERQVLILCTCAHNGYYSGWIEWSDRS